MKSFFRVFGTSLILCALFILSASALSLMADESVVLMATEEITVEEIEIVSISKSYYVVGDKIEKSDIKVVATYSNGRTEDVTDSVTITPSTLTSASSNKFITVNYQGLKATYTIMVADLDKIKAEFTGTKEYTVGESLDRTKLKVTAVYTDGTKRDVSADVEITPAIQRYRHAACENQLFGRGYHL